MALLQIQPNGPLPVKEYALGEETVTLGRHPHCQIVLDSASISREHARICYAGGHYMLEDLKSRNGTYLNGNAIQGRMPLFDGDTVRICDVELVFSVLAIEPGKLQPLITSPQSGTSVLVSDEPSENPMVRVKTQIALAAEKPLLNIANAEAKLRALIDICRNIGTTTEDVLPQMLTNLLAIFQQADCAYILMRDAATKRLELRSWKHRDPYNTELLRVSRTVLETVAETKAAILSDDVVNDSRFDPSESIVNFHIYSIMAVPIMDADQQEVLGVIQVDSRTGNNKFSYDDLDLLVSVAYQMGIAYENAALHDVKVREQINEREMNVAYKVQRGFLPDSPPTVPGYGFFGFYQPAKYLGGDYYDYIPLPDGRIAVALGDVSGKGTSAALLMAKLSSEVRYGLLVEPTFAKAVSRLNRVYCDPRWEDRFITFILAVIDPKTHKVLFYNAGHISPVLCEPGKPARTLCPDIGGLPLGVMDDVEYEEFSIMLEPGQKFALFSDGLMDAMNVKGEFFSLGSVLSFLTHNADKHVDELGRNLISAVRSFAGKADQTDDQCLVFCERM